MEEQVVHNNESENKEVNKEILHQRFKDMLALILEIKGMNKKKLAQILGFKSQQSITDIEGGKSGVTSSIIGAMKEKFKIDPNYFYMSEEEAVPYNNAYEKAINEFNMSVKEVSSQQFEITTQNFIFNGINSKQIVENANENLEKVVNAQKEHIETLKQQTETLKQQIEFMKSLLHKKE